MGGRQGRPRKVVGVWPAAGTAAEEDGLKRDVESLSARASAVLGQSLGQRTCDGGVPEMQHLVLEDLEVVENFAPLGEPSEVGAAEGSGLRLGGSLRQGGGDIGENSPYRHVANGCGRMGHRADGCRASGFDVRRDWKPATALPKLRKTVVELNENCVANELLDLDVIAEGATLSLKQGRCLDRKFCKEDVWIAL
ncbi:hypothetical protein Dimus_034284 [Dionaea muscipula]